MVQMMQMKQRKQINHQYRSLPSTVMTSYQILPRMYHQYMME